MRTLSMTDWPLLAQQKQALVETLGEIQNDMARAKQFGALTGLLHWVDALQDEAAQMGYPVVFLTEEDLA
jgi:hypothetical protein